MTLDAAGLVAIVSRHEGWETLVAEAMQAGHPRVPATALAEAGMILVAREDIVAAMALHDVVHALGLTVVPFTERDWFAAVREYHARRSTVAGPPARFGDCLSTVVAARTGSPLVSRAPGRKT